ncbi:hypothetical protein NDU88_009403 [Pleurodeles waltl]|uniref:Annexin n=2 Tax=Pleurodeles waltl TaxID=8319 RepID=A0AAV7QUF8_PLEWA|nr:hypothetical protein NDU88_009403 [Pleurodeles waltl]
MSLSYQADTQDKRMSYPGYPPSGYPAYPGYAPPGGDSGFPPGNAYPYPTGAGGMPQMAGGAYPPDISGGVPGAGGYPAFGGYPPGGMPSFPGGQGFGMPSAGYGAPPGGAGFGAPAGGAGFGVPAGYGAPSGGAGYGAPTTGPGYGAPAGGPGYSQPQVQNYGGGGPAPGGYPGGPAPSQPPNMPLPSAMSATQGTIKPAANFDALRDAEILRKAMKGFGTDEQAIINVIANRSGDQRQKIKAAFKTAYGKDLIKDLKSELSGNMEELILALFMPATYYDAWSLHNAMKGAGTQERVLIEILCTRTNSEIKNIVQCYKTDFGRDIEKDIRSDTSGHFERLLVSMCQGNRDENQTVNYQMAQQDAQRLYQAGEGKLGTDESSFNLVLASRSFPHLKAVVEAYFKIANRDLLSTIGREFSGNVENGLKAIVQCALNRPAFFAERLYHAMKGAGTDDSTLIRIIVSRSEIDLVQVKQAFTQIYQKTLASMISSDTSGDYRRLLVAITGQ